MRKRRLLKLYGKVFAAAGLVCLGWVLGLEAVLLLAGVGVLGVVSTILFFADELAI